ncbi:hypothetical protein GCM10023084_39100 [Streptomyces lacrimifluminis]|uniref:ADP-ribosylglycohydrolase n=1 Tax=Streptomyces lacrimifluminis TaxID=1500077 RepID=A0A917L146_9ACTN|nr:hypothetical protein GCM10012282_40720 [Streptomyces lacrimifluminis]
MAPAGTGPDVADRVLGGRLGRIAGSMLGKPVERGDYWTRDRIDRCLRRADALPLTDYLPEPPPGREDGEGGTDGFELRPEWRQCVRGRIHGSCRDDDVDYAILGLALLETHGFDFSTEQVGELWLLRLPFLQTFTAERAAYRDLTAGLRPPLTATYDNPYQEWIGALIRADIYGWTCPDAPHRAPYLARRDAVLSHTGNGVYGAMFAAALISAAFTAPTARDALDTALTVVPASSRLARTVRRVVSLHEAGTAWEDTGTVGGETAGLGWIHTVPNIAVLTAGLLYGDGDFTRTFTLTVRGGLDSDSNGATAGSVAGAYCAARRRSRAGGRTRWRTPYGARCSASTGCGSVNRRSGPCGWDTRGCDDTPTAPDRRPPLVTLRG